MAYATGNHGVRGRTVTFGRLIAFIFTAAIASTLVMHNRIFSHCATTQIATFDVSKEWLPANNDHDHFAQRMSSSVAPQREEQHGSIIHDSNNDRGQFSFEFKNVFERINQNQDAPAIINKPPPEDTWLLSTSHDIHASSFNGKIPKIINKIYYQKDGQFQDGNETAAFGKLKEAHKSWQLMNPGYDVRYFNLQSSRKYLQRYFHPVFLRTFDCIEAFAGKSDFFRLALLYHEGGWHSDWKQECLESNVLDKISDETDVFIVMDNAIRNSKHNKCVQNGFVGSIPGHSIVAKYLEITMQHVHDSHYKGFDLFATGPCVLGSAVKEEAKQHNDADKRYAQITSMAEYTCDSRKRICHFYWNNEQIVLHKCEGCGTTQDWELGNNYNTLFQNQNYYCEDSASIFAM